MLKLNREIVKVPNTLTVPRTPLPLILSNNLLFIKFRHDIVHIIVIVRAGVNKYKV